MRDVSPSGMPSSTVAFVCSPRPRTSRCRASQRNASGGPPVQKPAALAQRRDLASLGELTERGAHGRSPQARHLGEQLMRQRECHDDTARGHAAPAVGEVPEHEQQPRVGSAHVPDRRLMDERARAARAALQQRSRDRRPARRDGGEALVERCEQRRLENAPFARARDGSAGVVGVPRGG